MNNKAMHKLSYGLYIVTTKDGEKANGCIVNTAIQAASTPNQLCICINKANYTHDMVLKTGVFNVSVLSKTAQFPLYQRFGFQSGRDVDKFANITAPADENAVPYLGWQTCSVLSAKVVSRQDLGTHTLFIAEVTDAKLLSDNPPLTYADYQAHVKPKPEQKKEDKKIIGWRCKICNYVYEGSNLPEAFTCPLCGHGADDFEPIYENA